MPEQRPTTGGYVLVGSLVIAIVLCIVAIALGEPTPTEALLLSAVLTLLSIVASWVTAHYYAAYSSARNLKVFALKAAEKVTNLSNEFERLSAFLHQELEQGEYASPPEALLARDLRIEAAIHIINTLKGVNDGSLSDWQGVIGEEITAQREKQEEREVELRELAARLEDLSSAAQVAPPPQDAESSLALRKDIETMKADLRLLASQFGGVPIRRKKSLPALEEVQTACPRCLTAITYRQRPREGAHKTLTCPRCESRLLSSWTDGRFLLEVRVPIRETVRCPNCLTENDVMLDPAPGSSVTVTCQACGANLRAFRAREEVRVRIFTPPPPPTAPPDEEILRTVKAAMPPQPWPKGTSKEVARNLGMSPTTMGRALRELVRRGDFKVQIDGELFIPEPNGPKDKEDGA